MRRFACIEAASAFCRVILGVKGDFADARSAALDA
jgi:hypothetical protein